MKRSDVRHCVLDTNAIVHAINADSDRHRHVLALIERMKAGGHRFCVTEQIVREFLVVVTQSRFLSKPLSPEVARRVATDLLYRFVFLPSNNQSRLNLLDLIARHGLKGNVIHDANIVAVMAAHGVRNLLIYNRRDFSSFEEIALIDA